MEKQRIEEIAANRMQVIAPLLDPTIDHARYEERKADTAGKFQVSERTLRRWITATGQTDLKALSQRPRPLRAKAGSPTILSRKPSNSAVKFPNGVSMKSFTSWNGKGSQNPGF